MTQPYNQKIFSYGTLKYETVQLETFNRKLDGEPDTLVGYRISTLIITNPKVIEASGEAEHPVAESTSNENDRIDGMVFYLSDEELAQSDRYESADYKRVEVKLESGNSAWLYVAK